jgi:hypothetical protein
MLGISGVAEGPVAPQDGLIYMELIILRYFYTRLYDITSTEIEVLYTV